MLKPKHQIEVFPGGRGGWFWRARYVGPGIMSGKIVADGGQPYSNPSNARRAARRIGRVLMFAKVIDTEKMVERKFRAR